MKRWLITTILAFVLSFGGIGDAQTKSQFPKVAAQNAIEVEIDICDDVIISITSYEKDGKLQYYVYEVGNTIFAIVEFVPTSEQANVIYELRSDKTVWKFIPSEFGKLKGPCAVVKSLKLTNEKNLF
ncbi:MAG: hypothetical protein WC773_04550 [Patescibacteria group bacterium]|jgi:hypothetical protein